jgi:hypothetical protein
MMNKKQYASHIWAGLVVIGLSGPANAALVDRGGGLIYDNDLDITWLKDANYAYTSGSKGNFGYMTWSEAIDWVGNLSFFDTATGQNITDWRLPTTEVPDASCSYADSIGWPCSGSEMGHLFNEELGAGTAGDPNSPIHQVFQHVDSTNSYWSSTMCQSMYNDMAYAYNFGGGYQGCNLISSGYGLAWAVHDGDVGASNLLPIENENSVPEPSAGQLIGIALATLTLCGRYRNRIRKTSAGQGQ